MDQRTMLVEMRIPEVRTDANFSRVLDALDSFIGELKDRGYTPIAVIDGLMITDTVRTRPPVGRSP